MCYTKEEVISVLEFLVSIAYFSSSEGKQIIGISIETNYGPFLVNLFSLFPIVPLFRILEFWLSHIFFRCWHFLNKQFNVLFV